MKETEGVTVHATCIAIDGRGVLILGKSGSGKSDLAIRLIDRGALLVSDDYTLVARQGDRLIARAPATIAGKIEVRGVGIAELPTAENVVLCLAIDLYRPAERMPFPRPLTFEGLDLPSIALSALEASAPIKLEMVLSKFGLALP